MFQTSSTLTRGSFAVLAFTAWVLRTPSAHAEDVEWSYDDVHDHGPSHWGALAEEFQTCADGRMQSPIDLGGATLGAGPALALRYDFTPFAVENTGHTVLVPYAGDGHLRFGAATYDLVQFHFHTPSEHQVDGVSYAAELHLVHKNAAGELAVLGVFLREGHKNLALQALLDHAPHQTGVFTSAWAFFHPAWLLPWSLDYVSYEGSLTTPPCTEGVRWIVLEQAISASAEQIAQLHRLIQEGSGFDHDERPLQPLYDRVITRYVSR